MISKKLKKEKTIAELYPDGYRLNWHEHNTENVVNTLGLPIDIFYKLYPITTTWSLRQKRRSNLSLKAVSS